MTQDLSYTDLPTPNAPMLRKIWDIIQHEPEAHYQSSWRISLMLFQNGDNNEYIRQFHKIKQQKGMQEARCATAMCVAGLAADLDGGRWFAQVPTSADGHYLLPEPGEHTYLAHPIVNSNGTRVDMMPVVTAADRAKKVLGLTIEQTNQLFDGNNSKARIKDIIEDIIGEPLDNV